MPSPEIKVCQNCKTSYEIDAADFAFYQKIKVPPPTFCVECRQQRRAVFRNERTLYQHQCDLCQKLVISRISPDKPYPMYCRECWWSDKWDAKNYGREYDFSRSFFEQFKELLWAVPHVSLISTNTVNSEWVNQETDDKNCYLNFAGHFNENSAYNLFEIKGKECFDNYWLLSSELCYESVNCDRCYQTTFSTECFDCQNTTLSYDCRGCSYVFGCAGLRNKQYHIFNKPHTKEDYFNFLKQNSVSSYQNIQRFKTEAAKVWLAVPRRFASVLKSNNVSGHFITESKNSHNCWNAEKAEDCKNGYIIADLKDSFDTSTLGWSELCYETCHSMGLYNTKFSAYMIAGLGGGRSSNLEYCYGVMSSNDCFGCVNGNKMEYCILNKQYSKDDFENLRLRIIEQMNSQPYQGLKGRIYRYGEFFPPSCSLFGYNETVAQDRYPLGREQAMEEGYQWCDYELDKNYNFSDYQIPDDIREVKDDILDKVLKCETSSRPYRIIPMELKFYRQIGLPIPRRAPMRRIRDRLAQLLPQKLFVRSCQCAGDCSDNQIYRNIFKHFHKKNHCPQEIKTPHSPERPEIVYCEACYNNEIM